MLCQHHTGFYHLSVSRSGIKLSQESAGHTVKISRKLIRSYGMRQSESKSYYFVQVC